MKRIITSTLCLVFALGLFALPIQKTTALQAVKAQLSNQAYGAPAARLLASHPFSAFAPPSCQKQCLITRTECLKNNPRDKQRCVRAYQACLQDCASQLRRSGKTACLEFEPPSWVLGTQYGVPAGQPSGSHIFSLNGISASIHDFTLASGNQTFNLAKIDPAPPPISHGQSLRLNNINVEFDFSQLGFRPAAMEFKFLDLGGLENFAVNGRPVPIYKGELTSAPTSIGGVTVAVSSSPVPGGKQGVVTLTGRVKTFRIGGQEFWLDGLCAYSVKPPDPQQ